MRFLLKFSKKLAKDLHGSEKLPTFAVLLKTRAFSSAGSEHLPYKQRVGGSNPSTPTRRHLMMKIVRCLFFSFSVSMDLVGQWLLLRRLHSRHSIWQFSITVLPPSHHGVMWSPSINSKSNSLPQMAHL